MQVRDTERRSSRSRGVATPEQEDGGRVGEREEDRVFEEEGRLDGASEEEAGEGERTSLHKFLLDGSRCLRMTWNQRQEDHPSSPASCFLRRSRMQQRNSNNNCD